jgi:hypothetical protein
MELPPDVSSPPPQPANVTAVILGTPVGAAVWNEDEKAYPYFPSEEDPELCLTQGQRLHTAVPPQRWCVSKQDLLDFRRTVQQKVADGTIRPSDVDPFDATDNYVGPSVHTVNQQLILPVTEKAGQMSWALMLHPDGLDCDVYVTHCWQEGIYEFIDKVLNSWPRGAQSAYCCMLSNPQNLDIGEMVVSPKESPFAVALKESKYMLVVPNSRCSIYSRIWCAYEAYIAYSENKIIFTATAPVNGILQHFAAVLMIVCMAFTLAYLSIRYGVGTGQWNPVATAFQFAKMTSAAVSLVLLVAQSALPPSGVSRTLNFFAGACATVALAMDVRALELDLAKRATGHVTTEYDSDAPEWFFGIVLTAAFSEVYRLKRLQGARESQQLCKGYTGSLQDARSSVPSDKEAILSEIHRSGLEERVHIAVQVLLESGLSTPTLQAARCNTGMLYNAGYVNYPMVVLSLWCWFLFPTSEFGWVMSEYKSVEEFCPILEDLYCSDGRTSTAEIRYVCRACKPLLLTSVHMASASFMAMIGWCIIFARLPRDKRGFAAGAIVRVLLPLCCAVHFWRLVIYNPAAIVQDLDKNEHHRVFVQLPIMTVFPLLFAFALVGPGRISQLPGGGPRLVTMLLGNPCGTPNAEIQG